MHLVYDAKNQKIINCDLSRYFYTGKVESKESVNLSMKGHSVVQKDNQYNSETTDKYIYMLVYYYVKPLVNRQSFLLFIKLSMII